MPIDEIEIKKELFLATLMHDLKNPLQAQISCLNQLTQNNFGKLNSQQNEIIDLILESSIYMQKLIEKFLLTYKNENTQLQLDKKFFNPKSLIKICIRENQALTKEKNLKIIFNTNINNLIFADEKEIRRVIENILNNQINYAYKNTEIKINLTELNNYYVFSFENNSPEIDETTKKEIFEKLKSTNVTKQKISFGLGLYLCKQIIDAHKGKIYLESNKNQNKFIFEIPLK